ncbi:MAG: hypothetical protein Q8P54_02025 [bacterium]|nr:hypothetical protein [bacterium]
MTGLFFALISIALLFSLLVLIKDKISRSYCAICLAVSLTWIGLFVLYLGGIFKDRTLLALLMGESITGIYYLFEKRSKKEFLIFRLPFLLTLTLLFYALFQPVSFWAILLLAIVWLVFIVIFKLKNTSKGRKIVYKFTNCCDR